jgi:hypothetical protein
MNLRIGSWEGWDDGQISQEMEDASCEKKEAGGRRAEKW